MANQVCCNREQNRQNWNNLDVKMYPSEVKSAEKDLGKRHKQKCTSKNISYFTKSAAKVPDYVRVLMVTDLNGKKKQLHIPAALDLERPKRPRTTFTDRQLQILEQEYQENHFLSEDKRQKLSIMLNLSPTQIRVWYQNRRTKSRRLGLDTSAPSSTFPDAGEFLPFKSSLLTLENTKEKLVFPSSFGFGFSPVSLSFPSFPINPQIWSFPSSSPAAAPVPAFPPPRPAAAAIPTTLSSFPTVTMTTAMTPRFLDLELLDLKPRQ